MTDKAIATRPADALAVYREEKYNILTPVTRLTKIPPGVMLSWREVEILPDQCYQIASDTFGLGGQAIQQIAQVAGVSVVDPRRMDDRNHPHYSEFTMAAVVVDFDGARRKRYATKVLDLRDDAGSAIPGGQLASMIHDAQKKAERDGKAFRLDSIDDRLAQARKFIHEICATQAELRAIAKITGIKRAYSREELKRPFAIPKISLDPNDPDAKRAMLAAMSGASDVLFSSGEPTEKRVTAETKVLPPEAEPEKPDNAEAMEILSAAFLRGRKGMVSPDELAKIARELTGTEHRDEIAVDGAKKVADAVDIRVKELAQTAGDNEPDGVPY